MKQYENETRIVRPNYALPALVLVALGYYITFHIAEMPHTPNAILLKSVGVMCMLIFGGLLLAEALRAFRRKEKAQST